MTNRRSVLAVAKRSHSYFVVMIDFGHRGLEAIVQPERTRRDVVAMIQSGELTDIAFIHAVDGLFIEDVTEELMNEAGVALEVA